MNRIEELEAQIKSICEEIKTIQDACSHPDACLAKEHEGDTGNYDPSEDGYWTNFTCGLCRKKWTEDGTK